MDHGIKRKRQRKPSKAALRQRARVFEKAAAAVLPPIPTMDPLAKRHIVIVGGGVIGSTTAYFLTRHPKYDPTLHRITLLEATDIASGASGKAGGLLGLWAYPECLVPLSYRLHAELAAEHGGAERWGYRRVDCGSIEATVTRQSLDKAAGAAKLNPPTVSADPSYPTTLTPNLVARTDASADDRSQDPENEKEWEKLPKQDDAAAKLLEDSVLPESLDWVDPSIIESYREMGMPGSTETAQVHPQHFTTSIASLARERGVDIRTRAKVTRILYSPFPSPDNTPAADTTTPTTIDNVTNRGIKGVEYLDRNTGETVTLADGVTDVVVTAGPWTGRLLPRSKVEGLRAHSVVYEADVSPFAVFTRVVLPEDYVPEHRAAKKQKRRHKRIVDPEIYARPFREVYACGEPDSTIPLPETADQVQTDQANCDDLLAYIATFSPVLASSPVKAKQACYLPQREGGPIIGATSVPGLWVAAGHTCWGIQNGPGTGKLMAEMVFDGEARSADVGELDPRRYARV